MDKNNIETFLQRAIAKPYIISYQGCCSCTKDVSTSNGAKVLNLYSEERLSKGLDTVGIEL